MQTASNFVSVPVEWSERVKTFSRTFNRYVDPTEGERNLANAAVAQLYQAMCFGQVSFDNERLNMFEDPARPYGGIDMEDDQVVLFGFVLPGKQGTMKAILQPGMPSQIKWGHMSDEEEPESGRKKFVTENIVGQEAEAIFGLMSAVVWSEIWRERV